jgi:tRNA modification GTPase
MSEESVNRSLVLTPPGAGAIGVVRVVGPDALSIVDRFFTTTSGSPLVGNQEDQLQYGRFVDGNEVIDDVIVCRVPTRDTPTVDISAHGGVRVMERILDSLERLGARLRDADAPDDLIWATADLIEQEAVHAISGAKTIRAVRFAARQRAHLAEELESVSALCEQDVNRARRELEAMMSGLSAAKVLLGGATIAFVGPPNAGKSTLFNRLAGRSAAIVSPGAGTTRDWVTESVDMAGVPVTLADTAGRNEKADGLESQAAAVGWEVAREAQLGLLVLDGSCERPADDSDLWEARGSLRHCLTAINKVDKGAVWGCRDLPAPAVEAGDVVEISAKTGQGIEELVGHILASLGFGDWSDSAPCLFTDRQGKIARLALSDLDEDPRDARVRIRREMIGL